MRSDLKVYVIAINQRTRNPDLIADIQRLGLEYEVVEAIDSRRSNWPHETFPIDRRAVERTVGRTLTGGELGCALSHQRVYRRAASSKIEWSIILEDDAVVLDSFSAVPSVLSELLSITPRIVTLETDSGLPMRASSLRNHEHDRHTLWSARYFNPTVRTVAYAINRHAAEVAASALDVTGYADWPLWARQVDFWGLRPFPVLHPETTENSYLHDERSEVHQTQSSIIGAGISSRLQHLRPASVREYSRSLGGIGPYISRVLWPIHRQQIGRLWEKTASADGSTILLR